MAFRTPPSPLRLCPCNQSVSCSIFRKGLESENTHLRQQLRELTAENARLTRMMDQIEKSQVEARKAEQRLERRRRTQSISNQGFASQNRKFSILSGSVCLRGGGGGGGGGGVDTPRTARSIATSIQTGALRAQERDELQSTIEELEQALQGKQEEVETLSHKISQLDDKGRSLVRLRDLIENAAIAYCSRLLVSEEGRDEDEEQGIALGSLQRRTSLQGSFGFSLEDRKNFKAEFLNKLDLDLDADADEAEQCILAASVLFNVFDRVVEMQRKMKEKVEKAGVSLEAQFLASESKVKTYESKKKSLALSREKRALAGGKSATSEPGEVDEKADLEEEIQALKSALNRATQGLSDTRQSLHLSEKSVLSKAKDLEEASEALRTKTRELQILRDSFVRLSAQVSYRPQKHE